MNASHKSIKLVIIPLVLLLALIPHFLYYQYSWIKYVYFIGAPIITVKQEIDKYKIKKAISNIDLTTYIIQLITLSLCFIDYIFVEIFVWQISLGLIGVSIGWFYELELYENKYFRIWYRFTYFGIFIYFVLRNINLIY